MITLSHNKRDEHHRSWRAAPAIKLSVAWHALVLAAGAIDPALWPWLVSGVLANHAILFGGVFCPRGQLLGPNIVRLPAKAVQRREIALTFDDGPDPEVTPRVLDLLDAYQMKASFFCVGSKVLAYPAIVDDIARRGHSVENHSYEHSASFALWGPRRLAREVERAQATITLIAREPPSFFRAPNGFRSPMLDPVLFRCGLRYVSWTRRGFDTVRRDAAAVLRELTRGLGAGDILLMHDTARSRTAGGERTVLAVLPALLERVRGEGLTSVTLPAAFEREQQAQVEETGLS